MVSHIHPTYNRDVRGFYLPTQQFPTGDTTNHKEKPMVITYELAERAAEYYCAVRG